MGWASLAQLNGSDSAKCEGSTQFVCLLGAGVVIYVFCSLDHPPPMGKGGFTGQQNAWQDELYCHLRHYWHSTEYLD